MRIAIVLRLFTAALALSNAYGFGLGGLGGGLSLDFSSGLSVRDDDNKNVRGGVSSSLSSPTSLGFSKTFNAGYGSGKVKENKSLLGNLASQIKGASLTASSGLELGLGSGDYGASNENNKGNPLNFDKYGSSTLNIDGSSGLLASALSGVKKVASDFVNAGDNLGGGYKSVSQSHESSSFSNAGNSGYGNIDSTHYKSGKSKENNGILETVSSHSTGGSLTASSELGLGSGHGSTKKGSGEFGVSGAHNGGASISAGSGLGLGLGLGHGSLNIGSEKFGVSGDHSGGASVYANSGLEFGHELDGGSSNTGSGELGVSVGQSGGPSVSASSGLGLGLGHKSSNIGSEEVGASKDHTKDESVSASSGHGVGLGHRSSNTGSVSATSGRGLGHESSNIGFVELGPSRGHSEESSVSGNSGIGLGLSHRSSNIGYGEVGATRGHSEESSGLGLGLGHRRANIGSVEFGASGGHNGEASVAANSGLGIAPGSAHGNVNLGIGL